ncbi:MAG: efflux RND transporter periplasmic adaptor subunit [Clostridium sp.]
MKKKHIIFISIIVAIILSGIIASVFNKDKSSATNKAGEIELYNIPAKEKIFVNGIIVPEKTENIFRDESKGIINKVSVTDGQVVIKGDALFTYKSDLITDQIELANQQITTSNNQKKKLLDKQAQAKKLLAKQKVDAKEQIAIQKEQAKQQAAAQQAAQQHETQQVVAPAVVDSDSIVASLTASTEAQLSAYIDQIDAVQIQIDTLNNQVKKLKEKEFTYITAPIDGKVILNDVKEMTKPYIVIESTTFYVKGSINEKDQTKVKKDQQVDILIFATNKTLTGKVKSVGNSPTADVAAMAQGSTGGGAAISYYDANVSLDSQNNVINGFHVQATVKLKQEEIKIPKTSILEEAGKQYVFKVVDKKLTKLAITYKKSTDAEVIVLTGLKENDQIAKTTKDMKEGITVE